MQLSFKSGIHPASNKHFTDKKNITVMPAPKTVAVPLLQHIGKEAIPTVKVSDAVKAGQKIGEADGEISAPVFASCSGIVKALEMRATPLSKCLHVVIENDFRDEYEWMPPLSDKSAAAILERIRACGIVGMGGAGFPTHVKLKPREKVDTFIVNAAECEPYITCDYRILLEYTEKFLRGALYVAAALGLDKAYIGLEDNKSDAAELLNRAIRDNGYNVEVVLLKTKYPQGAEKQLIYAMTGRKVPAGGLPSRVGVIVDNVHTALSVCLAVEDGQPLYKRIVTVTGGAVNAPANIWAATGASYADIIEFCGGVSQDEPPVKLINGGPMMGVSVSDENIAATKTMSCLLLLNKEQAFTGQPAPCINCGKCAKACPMSLMPMYIDSYILAADVGGAVKYGALHCIECGCCAYVCPAKRPLVQSIRLAKKKSKEAGIR